MLTPIVHAVVLGIIQGLAEFIPVSSSGHLVLVPAIFGIAPGGLSFDVALHVGTMLAVVVYMRRELATVLGALSGRRRGRDALVYRRLAWFALAATVPVGIIGVALEDTFERIFATPLVAALLLFVTGALLLMGERLRDRRIAGTQVPPSGASAAREVRSAAAARRAPSEEDAGTQARLAPVSAAPPDMAQRPSLPLAADAADPRGLDLERMTLRQALVMGLAQCFALLPGISRSGTTIVAGMASGLTREAATRFSFLLSLPALAGAITVSLPDLTSGPVVYGPVALVAGIVAAFISGYLAIGLLISLVARERLTVFAVYCFTAGTLSLIALLFF